MIDGYAITVQQLCGMKELSFLICGTLLTHHLLLQTADCVDADQAVEITCNGWVSASDL
jgi:hypothetical protein